MTGAYIYTPDIWPLLVAAIFLGAMGVSSWRHRSVPAALPLAKGSLFATLWLLGVAFETAAVASATKIAWHKFQAAWQLPAATAMTCFALEYAYPKRWLTRRNLTLLSLPPLLVMLLIATNDAQFMWRRLEVAPDGLIVRHLAMPAAILMVYGVGLVLVSMAAFVWLFARSPRHRWPAALMLSGDVAACCLYGLYQLDASRLPSLNLLDSFAAALLLNCAMYAIALFGFRIFDPLPSARRTVIEQMREGTVVCDSGWRVLTLNPAAENMLDFASAHARGKTLPELLPAVADLEPPLAEDGPGPVEISVGSGREARHYTLTLSPLKDHRGLIIGHLLLLRDVTERRRAQVQILEQQRTLAVLQERERLARELHDSLGQALATAHLQASTAKLLLTRGEAGQVNECLDSLADTVLQAEADVRDYLLGAKTVMSAGGPFFPALREYLLRFTRHYGLSVELTAPPQLEAQGLTQTVEVQLFRIIQEALSNVRKHARANHAEVIFTLDGGQVRIEIADDGQGFDPAAAAGQADGYGLRAMRERAETAGGSLAVISSPGRGTQVVVHVPVRDQST